MSGSHRDFYITKLQKNCSENSVLQYFAPITTGSTTKLRSDEIEV